MKNGNRKTFVHQQEQSDCGVACLLSLVQYYEGCNSFENLRWLSGTSTTGTTLLGLVHAAVALGFEADGCEADIEALAGHGQPCILHLVLEGRLHHYVVCYGSKTVDGGLLFEIGDPAQGINWLPSEEFDRLWQTKACITLQPGPSFKKETAVSLQRNQWIKNLLKEDAPLLLMAVVLGLVTAVLGLCMAVFSQKLLDVILPQKNLLKLHLGIVLVFILLVSREGLSVLRQFLLMRQSKDFNLRITQFFYSHLLSLPKSFFDTRKIGELTARLNDTARIQRVIGQLAGNVIVDVLVSVVSIVFLFIYSWKVGVACLLVAPIFFYLIYNKHTKIAAGQKNIMSSYAAAEGNYINTLQGIEPIKSNNKQSFFAAANSLVYNRYQASIFSLGKIGLRLSATANIFSLAFMLGILLFTSYQVLLGQIKVGQLMAILSVSSSLVPSIANLAMVAIPLNEAKIAFGRMFEFTEMQSENIDEDRENVNFESLEVQNLSFRFAGRKRLLENISFEVKMGEIVAIMGENGCGKSTLIAILQKHYTPEAGNVLLNQQLLLADVNTGSWRKTIGIVPQQIHIFNGDVLYNVGFDDAMNDKGKLLNFFSEYGFDKFIDTLPQGYMTLLGEEGVNLSGGQKQMIAIARALYNRPQLLILDEATAAMDRHAEHFILGLLASLKNRMAIVFITHRLHVLKSFCDRVYIIENGVTTAKGNHDFLLTSDNLYSRYWADLSV